MTEEEARAREEDGTLPTGEQDEGAAVSHERSEDVAADEAEQEQAPADAPAELPPAGSHGECPLCHAGTVVEMPVAASLGGIVLACNGCGLIYEDVADLLHMRDTIRARSPQGWKGDTAVSEARGEVAMVSDQVVDGANFTHPIVVDDVRSTALVVSAIQYYLNTADDILAAAALVARKAREKAEFLAEHFDGPMAAVVKAQTAGQKKKYIDVVTSQKPEPTRLQFRHYGQKLVVDDKEATLAWAQNTVAGWREDPQPETCEAADLLAAAVVNVPEEVKTIPAFDKLDVAAVKTFWKYSGQVPDGCELKPEEDVLTIK